MKLGFTLRRILTGISLTLRKLFCRFFYLRWLLFDMAKFKRIDNKKIKSILLVSSGAVGDRYNFIGITNSLLKKYTHINLYWLTLEKERSFVKNPKIKVVTLQESKRLIDSKKIDALVVYSDTFHSEIFDWEFYIKTLKIPYRVGLTYSGLSSFFQTIPFSYTRRTYPNEKTSYGNHILAFEKLGFHFNKKIEFYHTPEAEKYAESFFKKNKISKKEKVIFIHPISKKSVEGLKLGKQTSKDWPYERWVELSNNLIKKYNCRLIFTGTEEENAIIKNIVFKINNKSKVVNTSGKLSLEQIASLLKRADLLVCLDTSITHIGAQSGVPVVVLLGNDPLSCYPWTDKRIMLFHPEVCNDCRRDFCPEDNNVCMKSINLDEVLNAVDKFLK